MWVNPLKVGMILYQLEAYLWLQDYISISPGQVIAVGEVPYEGCTAHIVDLCTYDYNILNSKNYVKLEESFIDAYVKKIYLKNVHSSPKRLSIFLDAKYENEYLNKVMNEKLQYLEEDQLNDLIRLIQKLKVLFYELQVCGKRTKQISN